MSDRPRVPQLLLLLLLALAVPACSVVGGIFKAGIWVGVIVVVVILALVFWLVGRAGGGGNGT